MKKLLIGLLVLGSLSSFALIEEVGVVKLFKDVTKIDASECLFYLTEQNANSICKLKVTDWWDDYHLLNPDDFKNSRDIKTEKCRIRIERFANSIKVSFVGIHDRNIIKDCMDEAVTNNNFYSESYFQATKKK